MKKNYVFGQHAVKTLVINDPGRILNLWCQAERYSELEFYLRKRSNIKVQIVPKKTIEGLVPGVNHQGFLAELMVGDYTETEYHLEEMVESLGDELKLLILDGVEDPHNLGACLRTACALGINGVIIPKNKACGITNTVYKVASGAVGEISIFRVVNLARTIDYLKKCGIWVYGAAENGEVDLGKLKFHKPWALVFGNEGFGMRRLTRDKCDVVFKIPMKHKLVSSLNVSVAVGVGLYMATISND